MITISSLVKEKEINDLKVLIENHHSYTGSEVAGKILSNWPDEIEKFKKVMPNDYKQMLEEMEKAQNEGYQGEEMLTIAFERKVAAK